MSVQMDVSREQTLRTAIQATVNRERSARRRAIVYTLIPLIVGGLWLAYSIYEVQRNMKRAAAARAEATVAEGQSTAMRASLETAQAQLTAIRRQIDSLKPFLLTLQSSSNSQSTSNAVNSVVAQTEAIRSAAIGAEVELRGARLRQSIESLFGPSSSDRQRAYFDINREFRDDPQAVDSLLSYASQHRGNPDGIYNTVVTLKTLSRAVTRPRRNEIATFCEEVGRGDNVARTAARCAELLTWIDTPR